MWLNLQNEREDLQSAEFLSPETQAAPKHERVDTCKHSLQFLRCHYCLCILA